VGTGLVGEGKGMVMSECAYQSKKMVPVMMNSAGRRCRAAARAQLSVRARRAWQEGCAGGLRQRPAASALGCFYEGMRCTTYGFC
jgi:hypothetical protein